MRERKARRLRERAGARLDKPSIAIQAPGWKPAVWIAVSLCVLNLAIYSGVTQHEFIDLDDAEYIYQNPHVMSGLSWDSVIWAFRSAYAANWHPLTWLSHMLDVQLLGLMNPGAHHAVSVLLHALTTLLLFAALLRMTGALGRSAFVAALFAAHPLHVESVAWAAERKDVLSAFFWMSTLYAYAWYTRQPSKARYAAVAALFACGLMSKPMVVTLPFTLLLLDFWPLGRTVAADGTKVSVGRLVVEKLPLLALSAASSVVTFLAQKGQGSVATLRTVGIGERFTHAAVAYVIYIGKTFWPADLAPFYHYGPLPLWVVLASAAGLAGLSALLLRAGRERPYLAVGWLWFLGTLVPTIGLIQVGSQAWADRYMYVPLIGLAIIISWGGFDALQAFSLSKMAPAIAVGAVVVMGFAAWRQAGYWQDSFSIWSHALDVTKDNEIAEDGVGVALYLQGRAREAIPHLENALRIEPNYPEAHLALARCLMREGNVRQAIVQDQMAIRIRPNFAAAHGNLGLALLGAGQKDEAVREFNQALRLDPNNHDAHDGLNYLARAGK